MIHIAGISYMGKFQEAIISDIQQESVRIGSSIDPTESPIAFFDILAKFKVWGLLGILVQVNPSERDAAQITQPETETLMLDIGSCPSNHLKENPKIFTCYPAADHLASLF